MWGGLPLAMECTYITFLVSGLYLTRFITMSIRIVAILLSWAIEALLCSLG
ncbi:hypothetical protein NIES4075_67610 [Tolypothrix sp. NIES-4075]|nr:hypothetical protein NIES4075_67610 [Tolypothrix sp. NIES-4075]